MLHRMAGVVCLVAWASAAGAQGRYYPDRFDWQRRSPAEAGMDAAALDAAVKFAIANENPAPRDLAVAHATSLGAAEPFDTPIGPHKPRSAANGLVIRHGRVVAEWGDTKAVDMTFSVTKTFLSTLVGLAWQKGLIRDVTDRARDYMPPGVDLFEDPHNQAITWEHLLRQTSDWKGTLWGKPDWADRPEGKPEEWANRTLHAPGTHYKYNDVRVNLLALALMNVMREPLPRVLKSRIMDPIGASSTWRWHGYDNSWVLVDGLNMQSVSGGGHFGGGMFISATDHARFGLLMLRNGQWGSRRLLSKDWIARAIQPSPMKSDYAYLWWLNTGRKAIPAAPESAFWAAGFGGHYIYIDREHDLVVVLRWTPDLPGVVTRVLEAIEQRG